MQSERQRGEAERTVKRGLTRGDRKEKRQRGRVRRQKIQRREEEKERGETEEK
jgi:hypothetical protein